MSLLPGFGVVIPAAGITVPDGLVHYWTMDSADEAGGAATDIIGGLNATLFNTPTNVAGQVAQGYDLDRASSEFLKSAGSQGPQSAFSLSIWLNTVSTNTQLILSKYSVGSPAGAYLQFFLNNGNEVHARIIQNRDADYIGRNTPSGLSTSAWHHIVMTWSGGTTNAAIKIYIDNSQADNANDGGGTFTAPYSGSDLPWGIGLQFTNASTNSGEHFFDGIIDDVRIYDRELSSSEVTLLYNAGLAGVR